MGDWQSTTYSGMYDTTHCIISIDCSMQRIEGHTSPVESVAFSISEQYIAAGSKSGTTKVFDLEHNQGELDCCIYY